jgi:tetratricopeptide (TPR) repeat protein
MKATKERAPKGARQSVPAGPARAVKAPAAAREFEPTFWVYVVALFVAAFAGMQIYAPALNGPFVYDDRYLPFNMPGFAEQPVWTWLIGVRPLLMLSFWLNYQLSELKPYSYHVFNVLQHVACAAVLFAILRKLLEMAGVRGARGLVLSTFGAAVFLLHPLQTESVAYVASRSETLSVLFFFSAFAVFLYRPRAETSWMVAALVVLLFGAAVTTKEHTVALPALLLLTDYFWNPGFSLAGIRRNWRLYGLITAAGAAALLFVSVVLRNSTSAGFGLKDMTPLQYFFSQTRAFFVYLRMFFLPFGQNVDHAFDLSRNLLDHGAVLALAGLVSLIAAAIYLRGRYPLACYGMLAFVVLLAPTSSFVPIRDLLVERRIYLPMIGLLLIVLDVLSRWKAPMRTMIPTLAGVLIFLAALAYARNGVWADPIALWTDSTEKAPRKMRPHFHLGYAYFSQGRCQQALGEYQKAADAEPASFELLVDWALAYDCIRQPEKALDKLRQAAALESRAHVYALIGMVYGKQRQWPEALAALEKAEQLDPTFSMTYVYRGNVQLLLNQPAEAASSFRRAIQVDPKNDLAFQGLKLAAAQSRTP